MCLGLVVYWSGCLLVWLCVGLVCFGLVICRSENLPHNFFSSFLLASYFYFLTLYAKWSFYGAKFSPFEFDPRSDNTDPPWSPAGPSP